MYKKSINQAVYNPVMYPINGSNLWVRKKYLDVQPQKYRKLYTKQVSMYVVVVKCPLSSKPMCDLCTHHRKPDNSVQNLGGST